jgi:hypothetical protein
MLQFHVEKGHNKETKSGGNDYNHKRARVILLVLSYLLECQLEPVATGDTISSPIMEIFVTNHTLDSFIIGISGSFGIGKDIGCIENIETLILHGSLLW